MDALAVARKRIMAEGAPAKRSDIQASDVKVDVKLACSRCDAEIVEECYGSEVSDTIENVKDSAVDDGWFFASATNGFLCPSCAEEIEKKLVAADILERLLTKADTPDYWEEVLRSVAEWHSLDKLKELRGKTPREITDYLIKGLRV